jgi:hypothetical protein
VNPLRGEAALVAGAKTYTLTFDVNAFCLAEKALAMPTDEIVQAIDTGSADLSFMRALIWAGLQRGHACTIAEAGDIVSDAGMAVAKSAMLAGLTAAFGLAQEDGDEMDPPKTAHGTGSGSSRGGAKQGKQSTRSGGRRPARSGQPSTGMPSG